MGGGKDKQPEGFGYTIVEVMIFLAISGVMFIMATLFINGKQAATQFTQGLNDLASRIQATIEEVSDGQYTGLSALNCSVSGGLVTFSSTGGNGQGTNYACVFLGKALHFSVANNPRVYEIIPVGGARLDASGNPITKFSSSIPTAMYKAGDTNLNALIVESNLPQNLSVTSMKAIDSAGTGYSGVYAFGLFTSPNTDTTGNTLQSGAQIVNLYYVPSITANKTTVDAVNTINTAGSILPASGIAICFDEGTNRQGAIVIGKNSATGGNNSQLTVDVDRAHGVTPCA